MTVWLAISAKGEKLYIESDRWQESHSYAKSVFHEDNPDVRATKQCDADCQLRFVGSDYHYPPDLHLEVRHIEDGGWGNWETVG